MDKLKNKIMSHLESRYTLDPLPVPDDLKRACLIQTAHDYKRKGDLGLGAVKVGDGAINVLTKMDLLPEVKSILKQFRKIPSYR